ncbi:hypothetical protein [Desulfococcus sp.]|uniref:hypothetical protein n=1 Tax=Desulfococcus sp. TaxID=2025834 RepID=UPI00359478CE
MTWQDVSFWEIVLDVIALCLCGTAVIALVRQKRTQPQPAALDQDVFNDVLARLAWEKMAASGEKSPVFHLGRVKDIQPEGARGERYHEVESLADSGLTAEEITERIAIPKGEVALVMKLKARAGDLWTDSGEKRAAAG